LVLIGKRICLPRLELKCLASTNPEYFGPAAGANPLCGWPSVLQGNPLGILDIYLPATLKTISLRHWVHLLLGIG